MNDANPTPAGASAAASSYTFGTALGDNPSERVPVTSAIAAVEAILRQPRRLMFTLRQAGSGRLMLGMLLVALACSVLYGVVVGSFSGNEQWWAAPVKVAFGLVGSTVICLPSLYIFACLSGSKARLAELIGLTVGLLMLMTLLLVGFAPVAWLFSQSTESALWMGALHLLIWLIATVFGLRFLYAGFEGSEARSNAGLNTWIVIFMLVMLQMITALRPLVGRSKTFLPETKRFFIAHWADCLEAAARGSKPAPHD